MIPLYRRVETQEELKALLAWASVRQTEAVHALLQHGSIPGAAEALGINVRNLQMMISTLRRNAASQGWSPAHDMTQPVPDGFHVKGVSTYYGKDGQLKGQWVKSQKDREHEIEMLLDALSGIAEPFQGKSERVRAPKGTKKDLLAVYPMGDPHIGMFAWAAETGDNFDLKIAERELVNAVDQLVGLAPEASEGLIINLGDFFHADTKHNTTTKGTPLDVDSRWSKVLAVGIRTMRRCIDQALKKHRVVHVINEIGNHDGHSALMLSHCLSMYYENNSRVRVDLSPETFHWFRFGQNLIGVTHGEQTKPDQLPGIMACDRKVDWGETKHRYWYTGHVHHDSMREYPGAIVETFRTLAPRDAWHHASGYRSGQDMKCDVLHAEYGRINRHIVGIAQIWGRTDHVSPSSSSQ